MSKKIHVKVMMVIAVLFLVGGSAGEKNFKEFTGPIKVGDVTKSSPLIVPYITWGGDMATFYANGGLETKPGSIFQKQGLNLKLVPGDDFIQQVRDYTAGKTPFLRGTFHMIGLASEAIAQDPRTKGVVILQMTWSVGDHMVARGNIKTVKDLKGKTIALQQAGPHVGMLNDVLETAKLGWDDVKIVWAKDLTASPDSPAEMFRKDPSIDACFVISPDMIGLTGGLQSSGTGAEGSVKGARVLVSTAELSRSITDVYVCRKDFYDANKDLVTKFVAGYFKAAEEVTALKDQYETKGSKPYLEFLKMAQDIYGKEVLPTLEEDAHGLLSDCAFTGYPGNVAFFTEKNNLHGFDAFNKAAVDLAVGRGYAATRAALLPSGLDYESPIFTKLLTKLNVTRTDKYRGEALLEEIEALDQGALDNRTIVEFTINFEPNQEDFSEDQYGAEYKRAVALSDKYGNAVIVVRGHSDPTKTLLDLVNAGTALGVIKRSGSAGAYQYAYKNRPLDLTDTGAIIKMIESGDFDGAPGINPRQTYQAALNLSRDRADAVRDSVLRYAEGQGIKIDKSRFQAVGAGIREPFIAKPRNMDEAKQNMRVEFRLIRVTAEAEGRGDFDF